MQKFTSKDLSKIEKLNKQLVKVEKKIDKLVKKEYKLIQKKLSSNPTKMIDWEFEVQIDFCVNEKNVHVLYETYKRNLEKNIPNYINDGENHNVASIYNNELLNKQYHCWLLHSLYDDSDLTWKKILKIDMVWFDIKPIFQYKEKIKL